MERNKSTIFLTVIAIATLLVAVVGATFAYFSTTVTGNDTAESVIIKTANLGVAYTNNNEINAANVTPGWTSGDKTFTIANTGDTATTYSIGWVNVTNTFDQTSGRAEELSYTLSCDNGTTVAKTAMPTSATASIASNIALAAGATHTCTINVSFANTSSEQNYNQNKSFYAKINVTATNVSHS